MSAAAAGGVRGDAGPRRPWLVPAFLAGAAIVLGPLAGQLALSGHVAKVLLLGVLVVPIILWQRPQLVPFVVIAAALTVEQFPYVVGTRNGAITDRIPLFHGLSGGLHVTPADLLLGVLLVFWLLKRGTTQTRPLRSSPVNLALRWLLGAVALGVVVGLAHHGQLRVALMESRPYVYLAATYFLATTFLTTKEALQKVLWAFVAASGFKAVQGVLLFVQARHMVPRPEAILGHEESVFFGLFIILTVALWLFQIQGRLRTTATILLPVVIVADLGNSRRTAWVIVAVGLVALFVVGFVRLPARRRLLRRTLAVVMVGSLVYFPAYWNHTGSLAQPARAIRSFVSPDKRDEASNLYRVQEDANLKYNIRQSRLVGKGFGVPIDYALPIVDISALDPLITYVPHNGVLYIFMRMGVLGATAFWSLIGVGIVTGLRLARVADRELAVFGSLLVAGLLAYVFMGYNDQGFFFYRVAFVIGSLLGIAEASLRLANDARGSAAT